MIKSGPIEQFIAFLLFQSLKEFHIHMEKWQDECERDLTKGELVGLKMQGSFSKRILGVCNLTIAEMLKGINEEHQEDGISRDTFKRMIKKAKSFGILTVYETVRENGSQSSNLYVFHRNPNMDK